MTHGGAKPPHCASSSGGEAIFKLAQEAHQKIGESFIILQLTNCVFNAPPGAPHGEDEGPTTAPRKDLLFTTKRCYPTHPSRRRPLVRVFGFIICSKFLTCFLYLCLKIEDRRTCNGGGEADSKNSQTNLHIAFRVTSCQQHGTASALWRWSCLRA